MRQTPGLYLSYTHRVVRFGEYMLENASLVPVDLETPSGAGGAFPVTLSDRWRVSYDPLQWILEIRQGPRWRARSFCVTREELLRCIREYCPKDVVISVIESFASWHPDRQ